MVRPLLDSVVVSGLKELSSPLEHPYSMLLVVYELTFKSLVFLVVVGDLSLSVLHILFELSLIEGVPHLQHPFTSFFPVQERPFEIVPIGPSQGAPPIELISLDAPNIGRPSC